MKPVLVTELPKELMDYWYAYAQQCTKMYQTASEQLGYMVSLNFELIEEIDNLRRRIKELEKS